LFEKKEKNRGMQIKYIFSTQTQLTFQQKGEKRTLAKRKAGVERTKRGRVTSGKKKKAGKKCVPAESTAAPARGSHRGGIESHFGTLRLKKKNGGS